MNPPRIAALTNRGKQRPENQDAVLALRIGAHTVIAVADGLGGLANGAVASRHAIQRMRKALLDNQPPEPMDRISAALATANREFVEVAEGDPLKAMGTTVSGLILGPDGALTFNIGDSRVYRLRSGLLTQLTGDHSVAADRVRAGLMEAGDLVTDPRRNQLTRCIGVDEALDMDIVAAGAPEPGDRYLVCSDGLYGPVGEDLVASLLQAAASPLAAAARLIDAANEAGGPDNVSAALAFFEER